MVNPDDTVKKRDKENRRIPILSRANGYGLTVSSILTDKQYACRSLAGECSSPTLLGTIKASMSCPSGTWLALPYSSMSSLALPQEQLSSPSPSPLKENSTEISALIGYSGIRLISQNPMQHHVFTSTSGTQNANAIEQYKAEEAVRKAVLVSTHASPLPPMSSRRPSDWRSSLSHPRGSAHPPSVTVVFAEPERSSPSASAAAKLSRKMSMQSIESKKRDWDGETDDTIRSGNEGALEEQLDETSEHNDKRQRTNGESPAPATETEARLDKAVINQRRRSWFSLRGKSSTQSLAASITPSPAPEEGRHTRAAEPPEEQSQTPSQMACEAPPMTEPIPITDRHEAEGPSKPSPSPSVSWFGSLPKRQRNGQLVEPQIFEQEQKDHSTVPQKSIWFTPQSPHSSGGIKTPSGPSSLGDQDPSRTHSPPLVNPTPELVSTQTSEIRLSALNPSSSRFTLSMPLLGRPKVPLEKALMKTGSQTEQGVPYPVPDTSLVPGSIAPGNSPDPLEAEVTAVDSLVIPTPSEVPSEPSVQSVPDSKQASWLEYIGFGTAKSSATSLPTQGISEASSPNEANCIPQASSPASPPQDQLIGEQGIAITTVTEGRPRSLLSGQTSASTWYSPWGWYDWYKGPSDSPSVPVPNVKTEAELIKEEALARPDPEDTLSEANDDVTQTCKAPTEDAVNPIASSVASNSRGWMSFFSVSRALTVKSVSERGEDGMEVMSIDENDTVDDAKDALSKTQKDGISVKEVPFIRNPENAPEPLGDRTPAPPLTSSNGGKRIITEIAKTKRGSSPAPSKKSIPPSAPKLPNLVLPTFDDTFNTLPRSRPPPTESTASTIRKTFGYVSSVLFARDQDARADGGKGKGRVQHSDLLHFGKELPRSWSVLGNAPEVQSLASCKNVVVIGVHGWFPGFAVRTVLGEPTGTSTKFANMMASAVDAFAEKYGVKFEQVTKIPLEGEGKIDHRVQKLYRNLTSRNDWMEALYGADVIFVATHSQGSIVSTHLISQLIADGHIRTGHNIDAVTSLSSTMASGGATAVSGPLAYLQKSSLVMPYIQYFESEAAAELFEFQDTGSNVSRSYVKAVQHVLDNGVKMVYIASLNDQVVPIYSGVFTCLAHPLILRSLYIDGDAYHSSDFLSNLLILLLRIRNAGLSDGGLLTHLSEATAGSLSGVGHSTIYEETATYSLAVDYLFLANDGQFSSTDIDFETFNARDALNDYDIPWNLRDLLADERVVYLFSKEFTELRDAFSDWHPRTTILRDLKRKLEPIRRLKLTSRL